MVVLEYEVYDSSCDKTHRGYEKEFTNIRLVEQWKMEQIHHPFLRIQNCRIYPKYEPRWN
jgi:hypothetical protein